jgi:threonine dehydrogenase-like Zn-dependent dehydrogenase
MKAAIYHGIQNVTVEEIPMPECGPKDVILKTVKAGICGTDIGAYYHGGEAAGIFPENQFGHEMSSIVYKVGKDVSSDITEGMRVFLNPCTSKRPDCGLSIFEIADECGAFSQYVQVQDARIDYNIFPLPANVSFDIGALVEPFSVAMHGVNLGEGKPGDKVVIFGAGMIGLSALCSCIGKGIKDIVVVDIDDWRLEKAKKMGAVPFNSTKGDLLKFLQGLYGDNISNAANNPAANIDLYIDTAGVKSIIPGVLGMAKHESRLVIIALYHGNIEINPYQILASEMRVIGSFAYQSKDIKDVIQCLEKESTPIEQIITHHFPLEKINEAFDMTKNGKQTLKVLIDHE